MSATRNVYADEPYEDLQAVRFTDGNRILCDVGYSGTIEGDTANARRIVACWNACEGFETEMLEDVVTLGDTILKRVMGMTSEIRRVNAALVKLTDDRDASRALLAELMDTELADMACAGSDAPVEDLRGRIKTFLESK